MAAVIQLTLAVDQNSADLVDELITQSRGDDRAFLRALSRRLGAYAGGVRKCRYLARVDDFDEPGLVTPSIVTIAITQASLVDGVDGIAIGTMELAWVSSTPGADEVLIGATSAECATNLAAKINTLAAAPGSPYYAGLLVATAESNVVTVTGYVDPRSAMMMAVGESGSGQVIDTSLWGGGLSSATMHGTVDSVISGELGIKAAY